MSAVPDLFSTPPALTLRELNRRIASLVTVPSTQNVWVTAELSDLRLSGGHCYFELIDKNDSGSIDSRLHGIIWAGQYRALNARFAAVTGQSLATGLKVLMRGSVNYHSAYSISFVVTDIDPSFTMGDVERRRREILDRLRREGILDLNRTLEWPVPALRIAVISAKGAAGYGDFMNQLYSNSHRLRFTTRLFPAVLQGEKTAESVIAALNAVMDSGGEEAWDCVVIIRGGGATSDLISFDSYPLAANVAQFPLPVIIGIGHERDVTVLDFVANMRVKTPTAAAEFLIARAQESLDALRRMAAEMLRCVNDRISGCQTRLSFAEGRLPLLPPAAIERQRSRLRNCATTLQAAGSRRIAPALARLDSAPGTLALAAANLSARCRDRLKAAATLLDALSPAATLRRGYTITRIDGAAVTSAAAVRPGARLETTFSDGTVSSTVINQS